RRTPFWICHFFVLPSSRPTGASALPDATRPLSPRPLYKAVVFAASQTLLDLLEIPQQSRRAPVYRRIAKLMAQLGWTPIRVRDLTGRGFKEQVRGYCRDARNWQ